jgi:hypothetical protein
MKPDALLEIMEAVRTICYSKSINITKTDQATLRRALRKARYSLTMVKEIEKLFYKNC